MPHFNSPNATPQQFKRHTSMAQMNGIAEAKVWHLTCNSVALCKRSFSQQKEENNFILSYTNLHFYLINSIFHLKHVFTPLPTWNEYTEIIPQITISINMHPQTFNLKLEYRIFAATERINKIIEIRYVFYK